MRIRGKAFLALALLFLFVAPAFFSQIPSTTISEHSSILSPPNYTGYDENLSLYVAPSEKLWIATFSGGNVTVTGLPSGLSPFNLILTRYSTWKSQFDLFTNNGFGQLGPSEPMPSGAVLTVSANSVSTANATANALSQRFGLVFELYKMSAPIYTFVSPMNFANEVHVYFWNLLPAGGFATLASEQIFEAADLSYFAISYGTSAYSISYGMASSYSSGAFSLYSTLGITAHSFNYSSSALGSSVVVHVLGGLVGNASIPFTNHDKNLSSAFSTSSASGTRMQNINATLNFSFPVLEAFRHVANLNPSHYQLDSVTVTVQNIGGATASNVFVNDSWFKGASNFTLQTAPGSYSSTKNLTAGLSMTVSYNLNATSTSGNFSIPALTIPYSYSFGKEALNANVTTNSERIVIGGSAPGLEARESVTSGSPPVGSSNQLNVTIINLGTGLSGTAFNVAVTGTNRVNSSLAPGVIWSFIVKINVSSLAETNRTVFFPVSWKNSSGSSFTIQTNLINLVNSFSAPTTPLLSLSKSLVVSPSDTTANVTLSVSNIGSSSLSNLTISDILPAGTNNPKKLSNSTTLSGSYVIMNVSTLSAGAHDNFTYSVNLLSASQNYVFLPANVSLSLNNLNYTHFSRGIGLPLGVSASTVVSPSVGFEGLNVTVTSRVTDQATLAIYQVSVNSVPFAFLRFLNSTTTSTGSIGGGANVSVVSRATMVGAPGYYNSSVVLGTYMFVGTNFTVSATPSVLIYKPVQATTDIIGPKVEEGHDISLSFMITNPTNVTISNISYSNTVPSGLKLISGTPSASAFSLAAGASKRVNITVTTGFPDTYTWSNGTLTFQYSGQTLKGQTRAVPMNVVDDIPLRYGVPGVVGALLILVTLLYVRRLEKK